MTKKRLQNVRAAAAIAFAISSMPTFAFAKEVYTFGIQPQWSREQMERLFEPLMDYLSNETGYEFQLRVTEDYGAMLDEMSSGIIDLAKFSPYGYVVARKTQGVRIFATEMTMGRPYYHGLIVTRKDSGLDNVEALRGRSFSYTDPNSASGFIYPRAMLVARGQDPHAFFKESHYTGSHDVCIRGVYQKKVDACATWDVAYADETHSSLFGVRGEELQIIHETDPIPNDAYAARADLDPGVIAAVQQALLKLSKNKENLRKVIDWKTRIDGYIPGDDSAYQVVRDKVALKDLKQRLAVLPFDKKGIGFANEKAGEIAAELLSTSLFDSQRFLMIERAKLDSALAEQRFELQDLVSESTAVRVGNVLGANVLCTGSVMSFDGKIHVTSRLIETETGRILSAQHAKGENLDAVIEEISQEITSEYEVRGFVLKVRNTENVTIDLGTLQGIKPGDVLRVYREGETLIHPVTNKLLGTEEVLLGEIIALRTTPEMTFAKVLNSKEDLRDALRVRTLSKNEIPVKNQSAGPIIANYIEEERVKYTPWLQKYAWRLAAVGSIPATWAMVDGDRNDKMLYGGIAVGLWAVTGGIYLYYESTEEERKVPSYLDEGR